MHDYDVIVIGGGPAGLAAALAANENGARVLVVEREERLGGMLKQCIHDGFGLRRFGERLAGPEYVERFMDKIAQSDIEAACNTFVTRAEKTDSGFAVTLVSREGLRTVAAKSLVLATGCREKRKAGVYPRNAPGRRVHRRHRAAFHKPSRRHADKKMRYPRFGRYRPYHGAQTYS